MARRNARTPGCREGLWSSLIGRQASQSSVPGIMQASTQHTPTKLRKAASTCTYCKSLDEACEKLNSSGVRESYIAKIMYRASRARETPLPEMRRSWELLRATQRASDRRRLCAFFNDPLQDVEPSENGELNISDCGQESYLTSEINLAMLIRFSIASISKSVTSEENYISFPISLFLFLSLCIAN